VKAGPIRSAGRGDNAAAQEVVFGQRAHDMITRVIGDKVTPEAGDRRGQQAHHGVYDRLP